MNNTIKKEKKNKLSKLVPTFFRNALRSNLDLTALADTKAGILISINGFILTVSVTASSFIVHNTMMTYAFIAIIITSLGSIILAVLAVRPRSKEKLIKKEFIDGYNSLLYYQDMASLSPKQYHTKIKEVLQSSEESVEEMTSHLHILGAEIKQKYFWLRYAYSFFSIGLLISAAIIINALIFTQQQGYAQETSKTSFFTKGKFYNIFEPSGATTLPDGKVMLVEDEGNTKAFKLVEFDINGKVIELGTPYMNKKIKKVLKKEIEDLEAITSNGNTIYALTSFSLDKENKVKQDRKQFLMLQYDDGAIKKISLYKKFQEDLEKSFPNLFTHNIIFSSDLNIEGLTYDTTDDTLYIGFRSPLHNTKAIIIGVSNPKEVFEEKATPHFTTPINLPFNALGIRAMVFDKKKNGYWIVAGGVDQRNKSFELWFYDKVTKHSHRIQNIPEIGFAEGITIVNENSKNAELFLVQDIGKRPNKSASYIIIKKDRL